MCKKILLLVLWSLSPFLVFGSVFTPALAKNISFSVMTDTCDLAAPTNFTIQAIGATWVTVVWTPTVPTADHRVKIFRSSDGALMGNVVIAAFSTPSTTFNSLVQGETYNATVCAMCPDGTDSKYKATISDFRTIIHDLVVNGIDTTTGPGYCPIDAIGEYCEFSLDGSVNVFRIQRDNGTLVQQFNVRKISGTPPKIRVMTNPSAPPYIFYLDDKPGDPNAPVEGLNFDIKIGTLLAASFEMYKFNSVGRLIWVDGDSNFEIRRVTDAPPSGLSKPPKGISGERDDSSTELQPLVAFAAPNPFSEILDVYLEQNTAEQVNLQLYNLSGQKVLDQQFTGGQEQYSLPTADLSPGFYMLRIEADGEVQTLKVIKSE
jgi:hypothetical protein